MSAPKVTTPELCPPCTESRQAAVKRASLGSCCGVAVMLSYKLCGECLKKLYPPKDQESPKGEKQGLEK